MDFKASYQQKLATPEQAAALVKSGDWVDYGFGAGFPELMDRALAARRDESSHTPSSTAQILLK